MNLVLATVEEVLIASRIEIKMANAASLPLPLNQTRHLLNCLVALKTGEGHHFLDPSWRDDDWVLNCQFLLLLLLLLPDQGDDGILLNRVNNVEEIALRWDTFASVLREIFQHNVVLTDATPDILHVHFMIVRGLIDPTNILHI